MRKPGIPQVPTVAGPAVAAYLRALQGNVDVVTGRQGGRITPLKPDATAAEIVAKVNEMLERLQG